MAQALVTSKSTESISLLLFSFIFTLTSGVSADSWKQFYYGDCTGIVEASGNFGACTSQQGASVSFDFQEGGCQLLYSSGEGCIVKNIVDVSSAVCYKFPQTGGSFRISCGE
jgi:hypothetical protein